MTTTTKLRCLMLPGYTQNASIYSSKLGAIRKGLAGLPLELVFVDPTHIMQLPTTETSLSQFDSVVAQQGTMEQDLTPRAWWYSEVSDGRKTYTMYEETITYLRQVIRDQGPFDAVLGFSQGAAMASILTALMERPHLHPAFSAPSDPPLQPFRFSILVAGFYPLDARCQALFAEGPLKTPSLHVLGRGDTIVGSERSLPLVDMFEGARVEWHDGGHHTPSKSSWRTFFKNYFQSYINEGGDGTRAEVASPSGSASGENSGTSTPIKL